MSITNYRVVGLAQAELKPDGTTPDATYKGARIHGLRVLPKAGNTNTTDEPALDVYIEREIEAGRPLVFCNDRIVITGNLFCNEAMAPGCKTFTQANTDQAIVDTPTSTRGCFVQAHPANVGRIWVGIGSAAADQGTCLTPDTGPVPLPVADLNLVHALATAQNDRLIFQGA